jgi:hypothetical protein
MTHGASPNREPGRQMAATSGHCCPYCGSRLRGSSRTTRARTDVRSSGTAIPAARALMTARRGGDPRLHPFTVSWRRRPDVLPQPEHGAHRNRDPRDGHAPRDGRGGSCRPRQARHEAGGRSGQVLIAEARDRRVRGLTPGVLARPPLAPDSPVAPQHEATKRHSRHETPHDPAVRHVVLRTLPGHHAFAAPQHDSPEETFVGEATHKARTRPRSTTALRGGGHPRRQRRGRPPAGRAGWPPAPPGGRLRGSGWPLSMLLAGRRREHTCCVGPTRRRGVSGPCRWRSSRHRDLRSPHPEKPETLGKDRGPESRL